MILMRAMYLPLRVGLRLLGRLLFGRAHSAPHLMSSPEDSELRCSCGLPAKLRMSRTPRNPYRLFYNCPNDLSSQCEFFRWQDEPYLIGDRDVDEINFMRNECVRLRQRFADIQQEREDDRVAWDTQRSELMLELSKVQAELDDVKRTMNLVQESDLMPPVGNLRIVVDERDDAKVIHCV